MITLISVGMIIELKCFDYLIVRLCLGCIDIRLVMKYLRALLWYNDVNVLIPQKRVVMKGIHLKFLLIYDYEYIKGKPYDLI